MIEPHPMPIVVGAPRSGTTLLRLMLDAHRELAIPPETGFLSLEFDDAPDLRGDFFEKVTGFPRGAPNWSDFQIPKAQFWDELLRITPFNIADGLRSFYRLYASRFGKCRWGDKTPGHSFGMRTIEARLPEARFIHLIRDGRDVALSWRPLWFSPGKEMCELAKAWAEWVQVTRNLGRVCQYYLEVRFEELVRDPEPVLQTICRFLELDYHECMVRFFEGSAARLAEHGARLSSAGQTIISREQRLQQQALTMHPVEGRRALHWKHAMSRDEQEEFARAAGSTLSDLGYES